jgi:hypothetical protein
VAAVAAQDFMAAVAAKHHQVNTLVEAEVHHTQATL